MIIPFMCGLISPARVPLTMLLIAINFFVFQITYERFLRSDLALDLILEDYEFLHRQGNAFASMIRNERKSFSPTLEILADQTIQAKEGAAIRLGGLALRHPKFMERALTYRFDGDVVALAAWREKFVEMKKLMGEHPSFQFGLTHAQSHWSRWLTYQFTHSGWTHLFWNMFFLFVFGSFVEIQLGRGIVALAYLGGGLVGAWVFSSTTGFTSSPLVGASAAVSALMGLVGVSWWRRERIKFLYFLLPMRGYNGVVLLPSWVALLVLILPDLGGYLASSNEFGAVAYSAHLGGAGFGAFMSLCLAMGWLVSRGKSGPVSLGVVDKAKPCKSQGSALERFDRVG